MSISNLSSIGNGIDIKCNSIETAIPIPGAGGDVVGPAISKNGYITTYDGVSGKIIKSDSTIAATANRLQAFDAFGLPNILEINSTTDHLGSDITNVNMIASTNISTDFIGSASSAIVEFSNKPQSNAPPTVPDDLTNKLYVDNAISGISGGDVVGPAGAQDEFVPVFDGTSGKIIKSSTIKATGNRFQGFDALNNPAPIEFNGDISLLGFDALNIGTIAPDTTNTNIITPKTGTSVSFNNQDIQDLNTVITANVNTDFIGSATGSIIEFSDKPQSGAPPTVDGDLTNKLYVDTQVGNFYSTLADGPTVAQGDGEVSLLPTGVGTSTGTLTVPGGGFSVGDTFHFVVAGNCIFDTNQDIILRLKNSGTLASIQMNLENTDSPNSFWELEADFTIRSLGTGGSGNGEVVTNFDFTFNKRIDKDFKGQRNVTVSNLNTTVSNTLDITAEFLTGDTSSINCRLGYLKKMH